MSRCEHRNIDTKVTREWRARGILYQRVMKYCQDCGMQFDSWIEEQEVD